MKIEIKNHLLYIDGEQVEYKKTPNLGAGRNSLQYLILHYTATASFSSPYNWLTNKESKVSAHLLIGRDGRVAQLAPFNSICWHAGSSKWGNLNGLNSHSIGIEMVNAGILGKKGDNYVSADNQVIPASDYVKLTNPHGITAMWQKYTDEQVEITAEISNFLKDYYKLKDILGHEDISPLRKTDPGPAFPWNKVEGKNTTKITTALVNIRTGPSTSHPKLMSPIPQGTQVEVLSTNGEWDEVEVFGKVGWVTNKYLKD